MTVPTDPTARAAPAEPSPTIPDDSPGWALAERVAWHLLEKNAADVVVLDLRGQSDVCDFYVVASGNSHTQVKAAARHLQDALLAGGHKPRGVEGLGDGRWALLDFFDVVVHVFDERSREYFQLERLWSEGSRLDLGADWFAAAEVAARHADLDFTVARGGAHRTGD